MKSIHTINNFAEGNRIVYTNAASELSFAKLETAQRWADKIEKKTGVKCTPAYRQTKVGNWYYLIASDYIAKGTWA